MANWSLSEEPEKMANDGDNDFHEEDVWYAMKTREAKSKAKSGPSSSAWQQYSSAMPREIPRESNNGDHASLVKRLSAPVNIPDWSKIYGKKKKRKGDDDEGEGDNNHDDNGNGHNDYRDRDEEDEDEDEDGVVPPHEWLARKLARSQISSFSVCEGVGRTLKGRDLSRVRNAILTKTGFLE